MKFPSNKSQWEKLNKFKKRFLKQKRFSSFPRPYEDRMQPIMHTGYLMYIRNKFLFLGLLKSIEEKNLYISYAVLKSYWENVATFGYYFLRIASLLKEKNKEDAFALSKKMGLGGRGFLTKEMVQKKGQTLEDFTIPKISKMMKVVDDDWKKILGDESSLFRQQYNEQIAEGGHTTFTGLSIAARWLPDKSQLPDVERSWNKEERASILNLTVLSSIVFFLYWDKFVNLEKTGIAP